MDGRQRRIGHARNVHIVKPDDGNIFRNACAAFAQTVQALPKDAQKAFFVVHGGTIMALLSGFARPAVSYYDVLVKNCCGYVCTLGPGDDDLPLTLCGIRYVQSISEAMA